MTKRTVKTVYAVALATLVALLIAMTTLSYAIYKVRSDDPHNGLTTGTFKVQVKYGFEENGVVLSYVDIDSVSGSIVSVNIHNPAAADYIGKFRLMVSAESNMESVMRVMVSNIWRQNDADGGTSIPRLLAIKFDYDNVNFVDNTRVDSGFYYCNKAAFRPDSLDAYILSGIKDFELIGGINQEMDIYEENVSLSLYIRPYIVQSNRFAEHWQIPSLPLPA